MHLLHKCKIFNVLFCSPDANNHVPSNTTIYANPLKRLIPILFFEFECSGVKLNDQQDGCHNVSSNGDAQ